MSDSTTWWLLLIWVCAVVVAFLIAYLAPSSRRERKEARRKWDLAVRAHLCVRCGAPIEKRHPSTNLNLGEFAVYCDMCARWKAPWLF